VLVACFGVGLAHEMVLAGVLAALGAFARQAPDASSAAQVVLVGL
jgi:hypothetical protein